MPESVACREGHLNTHGGRFCVVCGELLAVTPSDSDSAFTLGSTVTDIPAKKRTSPIQAIRSRISKNMIIIALGSLVGVVAVVAALYFVMTSPVPDVSNVTTFQAESTLEDAGFVAVQGSKEFSDSVPKGSVVSQDPGPGGRTSPGGDVTLTISRGPMVSVPNFVGKQVSAAQSQAQKLNIRVDSRSQVSETVPEGEIIAQEQSPGSQVEEESAVSVTVSSGPPRTTVTFINDIADTADYLRYSWMDCDLTTLLWRSAYPNPVIQNGSGETLASGGSWLVDSANGSYFPCRISIKFNGVATGESEYRIVFDTSNAERNKTGTISRARLESAGWVWEY